MQPTHMHAIKLIVSVLKYLLVDLPTHAKCSLDPQGLDFHKDPERTAQSFPSKGSLNPQNFKVIASCFFPEAKGKILNTKMTKTNAEIV